MYSRIFFFICILSTFSECKPDTSVQQALEQCMTDKEILSQVVKVMVRREFLRSSRREASDSNFNNDDKRDPRKFTIMAPLGNNGKNFTLKYPGDTLLQPKSDTLKSAANYPNEGGPSHNVYGNFDNVGIKNRYHEYTLNTGFRRHSKRYLSKNYHFLNVILEAAGKVDRDLLGKRSTDILLFGELDPKYKLKQKAVEAINELLDGDNTGAELLEESETASVVNDFRRSSKRKQKRRDSSGRGKHSDSSTDSDTYSSSDSSSGEKNPGNPFTAKKGKYLQNWNWNYKMDGDHMNLNPNSPNFPPAGPSGSDVFFARKWWYFHQDDYLPF